MPTDPTHFEDVAPDVRPAPLAGSFRAGAIGIYPDGDPEGAPSLTLSEDAAYDLAVDLLAAALAQPEGVVRDVLRDHLDGTP